MAKQLIFEVSDAEYLAMMTAITTKITHLMEAPAPVERWFEEYMEAGMEHLLPAAVRERTPEAQLKSTEIKNMMKELKQQAKVGKIEMKEV